LRYIDKTELQEGKRGLFKGGGKEGAGERGKGPEGEGGRWRGGGREGGEKKGGKTTKKRGDGKWGENPKSRKKKGPKNGALLKVKNKYRVAGSSKGGKRNEKNF